MKFSHSRGTAVKRVAGERGGRCSKVLHLLTFSLSCTHSNGTQRAISRKSCFWCSLAPTHSTANMTPTTLFQQILFRRAGLPCAPKGPSNQAAVENSAVFKNTRKNSILVAALNLQVESATNVPSLFISWTCVGSLTSAISHCLEPPVWFQRNTDGSQMGRSCQTDQLFTLPEYPEYAALTARTHIRSSSI